MIPFNPPGGLLARRVTPYSDPYNDVAQFNLPPSQKSMMVLCRRLFLTMAPINAAISKYSNYPITDITVEANTAAIRTDWETMADDVLKLKKFNQAGALDYNVQGNFMASLGFPFVKVLICPVCNFEQMAEYAKYRFNRNGKYDYTGRCPGCKRDSRIFIIEDRPMRKAWNQVSLIRWPPLTMDLKHNPYAPRKTQYYHRIPREMRAQILNGDPFLTSTLPIEFIQAARFGKRIKIKRDNFFHLARPSISDTRLSDAGWGTPLLLPVIKNTYRYAILTRSQEAMAQNRILPLRMIWPNAGNQPAVVGGANLGNWRGHLEEQIKLWLRDPNHIAISGIPMSMGTLGADSKPMLLNQEILAAEEGMVIGMGIPKGFVYGDLNFSGASISLRMLENEFIGLRADMMDLNDGFIRSRIQTYLNWPHCRFKFSNLRSADDMQRMALMMQLLQGGVLSKKTVLSEMGFDYEAQVKQRKSELDWEYEVARMTARNGAEAQGLGQMTLTRWQAESQALMQDLAAARQASMQAQGMDMSQTMQGNGPGAHGGGIQIPEPSEQEAMEPNNEAEIDEMLQQHVQELQNMTPEEQMQQLNAVQSTNPSYAQALSQESKKMLDLRPLPNQKPPRRDSSPI